MALGAMLGGIVVSNTGTGNDHALARALGGLCDTPHGLATAIFIPHVLEFNAIARPRRYGEIARALGLPAEGTHREVAKRLVDELHQLLADLGIPARLSAIGVGRELIPDLVKVALKNVGPNPRRTTAEDLQKILEAAY
jgi:alcohol dehydrogenase class IV